MVAGVYMQIHRWLFAVGLAFQLVPGSRVKFAPVDVPIRSRLAATAQRAMPPRMTMQASVNPTWPIIPGWSFNGNQEDGQKSPAQDLVNLLSKWTQPQTMQNEESHSPPIDVTTSVKPGLLGWLRKRKRRKNQSSFMSVARWPDLKLFSFAGAAWSDNQAAKSLRFPGAHVVLEGDPVPNVVGQAAGFADEEMVPVLNLKLAAHEKDKYEANISALEALTQDWARIGGANLSAFRLGALFAKEASTLLAKHNSSQIYAASHSSVMSSTTPLEVENAFAEDKADLQGRASENNPGRPSFPFGSDWGLHNLTLYSELVKSELLRRSLVPDSIPEMLQTYRMARLTEHMSFVDTNMSNVMFSLRILNGLKDPLDARRPLYSRRLEHVMTFAFYTPARNVSRVLNRVGYPFGLERPIGEEGIAHNVHLLKDSANNGYLTFQGTACLGTWFDIHLAYGHYDPNTEEKPFAAATDDERWAAIEQAYFHDCHTGFCHTLKTFVSDKNFPELAKRIAQLKSVSVVGFSFGGSMAGMLAMSAAAVKEFRKKEKEIDITDIDDSMMGVYRWPDNTQLLPA
jgi:hypothetical protein